MFQIGEVVSYGATGICTIEDIRMEALSRSGVKKQEYYILRPIAAPTCITYVPTGNEALAAKIRRVLNKEQIDEMILSPSGNPLEWIDDVRQRTEVYGRILEKGISAELLALISCLYLQKRAFKKNGKKLCITDEKLLSSAERMVSEEFSYALQIPKNQVSAYIADKLGSEPV